MNENLTLLIDAFCARYAPAVSLLDSTDQVSSGEMLEMFNSTIAVEPHEITQALKVRGFLLECIDFKFVWLIKEKGG